MDLKKQTKTLSLFRVLKKEKVVIFLYFLLSCSRFNRKKQMNLYVRLGGGRENKKTI
jgi:hypothetical protein